MARLVTTNLLRNKKEAKYFRTLFPFGMPLTEENIWKCHGLGIDVIRIMCRLMTQEQRNEFIPFTMRQRQPNIVLLFQRAGLDKMANTIEALNFEDLKEAYTVFCAAWQVAQNARCTSDDDDKIRATAARNVTSDAAGTLNHIFYPKDDLEDWDVAYFASIDTAIAADRVAAWDCYDAGSRSHAEIEAARSAAHRAVFNTHVQWCLDNGALNITRWRLCQTCLSSRFKRI